MPHQEWTHRCSSQNNAQVRLGVPVCQACGYEGTPSGLGLTGIEARGNFQKLTGLPSIGPHMKSLPKFTENCPACGGRSVIQPRKDGRWITCRSCQGTGAVITVSATKFIQIQKDAWALFDAWMLKKLEGHRRLEFIEKKKYRRYRGIPHRDHSSQKVDKRTRKYFEISNRLMVLGAAPEEEDEAEISRLLKVRDEMLAKRARALRRDQP